MMLANKYLKLCAKTGTSFSLFVNISMCAYNYFPIKSIYSESVLNLPYVFSKASINEKTATYKKMSVYLA